MNIIPQLNLFSDNDFDELGDLERLQRVLAALPDEELIQKLNQIRGNGRNDWPGIGMWNAFLASFLFNHETVEQLLRELRRNKQLRAVCGLKAVGRRQPDGTWKAFYSPSKSSFSKFLKNLESCKDLLKGIFEKLVQYMYDNLDGFGTFLMIDGKAIQSFARKPATQDGRRGEHDADWCRKTYTCTTRSGEVMTKTMKWFGFRLHLIADATYEMPVAFEVTKASNSEQTECKNLINTMEEKHPEYLDSCQYFMGDKGYDSNPILTMLKEKDIVPIIDICNKWKDGEETHQYKNTPLVYNYKGDVFYVPDKGEQIKLAYKGYDKSSDSLRYGFHPKYNDNRIFRIKCSTDPRIFNPVARDSKKWERLYKMRTGVERINGRIDRDYQFEHHTIRGLEKMNMFILTTFIVYLGIAKSKVEQGQTTGLARLYA